MCQRYAFCPSQQDGRAEAFSFPGLAALNCNTSSHFASLVSSCLPPVREEARYSFVYFSDVSSSEENISPQKKGYRMLKIQIMGGSGSGKTTLGAEIGTRFDLPFYETDVLGRKNGTQHTAWIQDAFAIISLPGWVIDGGGLIWNDPILIHADYIVLLEVPWRTAAYRIVRRHIIKSLRGINPYPGIRSLILFLISSRRYYLNQCSPNLVEAMNRCLEEQRMSTEPLDAERLLARLETYGIEIIIPPTAAFVRQYLEKYKQKLIIVRNNADRAHLLDFLAQQR